VRGQWGRPLRTVRIEGTPPAIHVSVVLWYKDGSPRAGGGGWEGEKGVGGVDDGREGGEGEGQAAREALEHSSGRVSRPRVDDGVHGDKDVTKTVCGSTCGSASVSRSAWARASARRWASGSPLTCARGRRRFR
jgi:hypothetical protein